MNDGTIFTELEERQIEGIRMALASLDRGEGVSHDVVEAWVASLGTENELPMPKAACRPCP